MQRYLIPVVGLILTTVAGCTGSPAAPSSLTAPSAARFAGDYTLTIQIDEKCSEFPISLKVWAYDAVLEDHGYISIRISGGAFSEPTIVGQLYLYGDARHRLLLNLNYDEFDRYPESPALFLYGSGDATASDTAIAGAIVGDARLTGRGRVTTPECAGAHRFTFVR